MSQDGKRLGCGEAGADAQARAAAKRQILETMALLAAAGEPVGNEGVGIVPQDLVTVDQPGPDRDDVAGFDLELAELVRLDRLAVEA